MASEAPSESALPTQSKTTSAPSVRRPASTSDPERRRTARASWSGIDHRVGAERPGELPLARVLGPDHDRARLGRVARDDGGPPPWRGRGCRRRRRPPRPRPGRRPASTAWTAQAVGSTMTRVLVAERVGHRVDLGARGPPVPPSTSPLRCRRRSRSGARGRGPRRPRCRTGPVWPAAQYGHGGSMWRGAHPSTGSMTTRVPGPSGRPAWSVPPSSRTPTTSWPGTNGKLTRSSK